MIRPKHLAVLAALLFTSGLAEAADVEVHKHPQCGCCIQWARHLTAAGFDVTVVPALDNDARWQRFGIPDHARACHTAVVDGYVVEGHVPAADVARLLSARPDARGLAVAGMPMGSPGMEGPRPQAYDVLLIAHDGATTVFARHRPGG